MAMRNPVYLLLFLCGALLAGVRPVQAKQPPPLVEPPGPIIDTVKERAINLLKANLQHLSDLYTHTNAFKSAYAQGAKVFCDVCADPLPKDVSDYVYAVGNAFPGGFKFTFQILIDRIEKTQTEPGYYEITIPFRKRVPKVSATGEVKGGTQELDLVCQMEFAYPENRFAIVSVLEDRAPASNVLMLELSPLFGLGSLQFDGFEGQAPTTQSRAYNAGIMYYFNPFRGTNRGNIWLKAGLRAGLRQTELTLGGATYQQDDVALQAAQGVNIALDQRIDLTQQVAGIKENVNAVVAEVPVGLAKRWNLNREVDLVLELEAGYGFALSRKVDGQYDLDQTGTNHTVGGAIMQEGGGTGAPRFYDAPNAAVIGANGDRIDFFTGRTSVLDGIDDAGTGYLFFGLNPSLLLRQSDKIRYNIGLRFSMMGTRAVQNTIDPAWFLNEDESGRPSITSTTTTTFQPFVGAFLGLNVF